MQETKTAVIKREKALGDVIFAEPVVRALKKTFERVFVVTNYPEVFTNNPHVTGCNPTLTSMILEDMGKTTLYDLDGAYEKDLEKLVVDSYLEACGCSLPPEEKIPKIWLSDEEKAAVRRELGDQKWVAIDVGYPALTFDNRPYFWPSDWTPILELIRIMGFKTILVGNVATDKIEPIDVDLRCRTSPRQLFAVIEECDYFLGVNSGPSNVAQAVGTPGVAIYAPNHGPKSVIVPGSRITPVCWEGKPEGMPENHVPRNIPIKEIIEAFVRCLNGDATPSHFSLDS